MAGVKGKQDDVKSSKRTLLTFDVVTCPRRACPARHLLPLWHSKPRPFPRCHPVQAGRLDVEDQSRRSMTWRCVGYGRVGGASLGGQNGRDKLKYWQSRGPPLCTWAWWSIRECSSCSCATLFRYLILPKSRKSRLLNRWWLRLHEVILLT